jgi:hypothetical protein
LVPWRAARSAGSVDEARGAPEALSAAAVVETAVHFLVVVAESEERYRGAVENLLSPYQAVAKGAAELYRAAESAVLPEARGPGVDAVRTSSKSTRMRKEDRIRCIVVTIKPVESKITKLSIRQARPEET